MKCCLYSPHRLLAANAASQPSARRRMPECPLGDLRSHSYWSFGDLKSLAAQVSTFVLVPVLCRRTQSSNAPGLGRWS